MFEIFYGCMFSEKSGDMLSRALKEQKYAMKKVVFFKPTVDTRTATTVSSRIGLSATAHNLTTNVQELIDTFKTTGKLGDVQIIDENGRKCYDIIAFDEIQFYSKEIVQLVKLLLNKNIDVMAVALNLDYLQQPIGSVGELILIADEAVHKTAYCSICGEKALFSQRVVNGTEVVSSTNDSMVEIGDSESYEPRCRKHFCTAAFPFGCGK